MAENDLVPPTAFMEFLPLVYRGDSDAITEWLRENITNGAREFQLLQTLPRWAAIIAAKVMGKEHLEPDEGWGIFDMAPEGQPRDQSKLQTVQLIVAALNDEADIISGICNALMDAPMEHRSAVEVQLMLATRDFLNMLHAQGEDV